MLAAISDDTIAVWDAHSGDLEQRLRGHTFRTHVLECHPLDPRLVMSAGYDGQTIVWDLVEGQALARCGPLLCLCPLRDSHFLFIYAWLLRCKSWSLVLFLGGLQCIVCPYLRPPAHV